MTRGGAAGPFRIDTRGLRCPWPVLRAARAMRDARTLTLLADDPVALTDVPALARAHGWSVEIERGEDHFTFHLADGRANSVESAR